jgi:hypothetical protein
VNAPAPTDAIRDAMTNATLKPILNRRDFRRIDNLHQDQSAARTWHAVAAFPAHDEFKGVDGYPFAPQRVG